MDSRSIQGFHGVWGSGPHEVFAVGACRHRCRISHFDGTRWWPQFRGQSRQALLLDVWASGPDDVFAVGRGAVVLHYDGQRWSPHQSGLIDPSASAEYRTPPGTPSLRAVWGTGPYDVFAVGDGGAIIHYDGERWRRQPSPGSHALSSVWGRAPDDVFAVSEDGFVLHYDGASWDVQPTPDFAGQLPFVDVHGVGDDDVYALTSTGTLLHHDGEGWRVHSEGLEGRATLWVHDFDDIVVAGPSIHHYDGRAWSERWTADGDGVEALWASGPEDAWAVGQGGLIMSTRQGLPDPSAEPPSPRGGRELLVRLSDSVDTPLMVGILWINEDAPEVLATQPLGALPQGDGELSARLPLAPPLSMIRRLRGGGAVALGYVVAFHDVDGNGRLTEARGKLWSWPEFAGISSHHVVVYSDAPIASGDEHAKWVGGALDEGMHLMAVEPLAQCEGDRCRGYDRMHPAPPGDARIDLQVRGSSPGLRVPNVD